MDQRAMVEIDAPPEKVFGILADADRLEEWVVGIVENEELEKVDGIVGSTFRQVYEESGRPMEFHGVVTAYDENRAMAIHLNGGAFDLDVGYRLEELDGGKGTRLIQDSVVHYKGIWKLIGFLMGPLVRKAGAKKLAEDFGRLKKICEG